jgi:hypothetical protein
MTKARPILFSAPMIRALREGRKTQTRRILKQASNVGEDVAWAVCPALESGWIAWFRLPREDIADFTKQAYTHGFRCPYGQSGNLLWVRETFHAESKHTIHYRADGWDYEDAPHSGWKPSIYMPKWASRLTLEITDVRVERLQYISEQDAIAEGVEDTRVHKGQIATYQGTPLPGAHRFRQRISRSLGIYQWP